jgi:hypothetical protein
MIPLHRDRHYTFRFDDDRFIDRFHLDGVAAGVRVMVYRFDPAIETRLGLLATAMVGEGGWVNLPDPLIVRAGEGFAAVAEEDNP